jgi:hypothetical protein
VEWLRSLTTVQTSVVHRSFVHRSVSSAPERRVSRRPASTRPVAVAARPKAADVQQTLDRLATVAAFRNHVDQIREESAPSSRRLTIVPPAPARARESVGLSVAPSVRSTIPPQHEAQERLEAPPNSGVFRLDGRPTIRTPMREARAR